MRVTCPCCRHEFEADVSLFDDVAPPTEPSPPPRRTHTRRGLSPVDAPAREDAATCSACGLVRSLHEGEDNLAWVRYGCDGFLERR